MMPQKKRVVHLSSSEKDNLLSKEKKKERRACFPGPNPGPNLENDSYFSAKNYWIKLYFKQKEKLKISPFQE